MKPTPQLLKFKEKTNMEKQKAITKGLTGLPVTEERAAELAMLIANKLHLEVTEEQETLNALMELLLGVIPNTMLDNFDCEEFSLEGDLHSRYTAGMSAVETLYGFSDDFRAHLEAYVIGMRPKHDFNNDMVLGDDNLLYVPAKSRESK
jgi:hypothetical protein